MAVKQLAVDSLRIDGGTQLREKIDQATVDDYRECWVNEVKFPPLVVFFDGTDNWLADGFHRYHGASAACLPTVPCDVRNGTLRDAILFAAGANQENGLRRSNEDKRKIARTLLNDKEWGKRSSVWIAEHCGVSHTLVDDLRKQPANTPDSHAATAATRRIRKDGKEYTVNPKKKKAKAKPAESAKPANGKPSGGNTFNPAEWEVKEDSLGVQIPSHLRSIAEDRFIPDTVKHLNGLTKEIKSRAGKTGGEWIVLETVLDGLYAARNMLINAEFHCVCFKCGGDKKGCGECRRTGFLPKWRVEELEVTT